MSVATVAPDVRRAKRVLALAEVLHRADFGSVTLLDFGAAFGLEGHESIRRRLFRTIAWLREEGINGGLRPHGEHRVEFYHRALADFVGEELDSAVAIIRQARYRGESLEEDDDGGDAWAELEPEPEDQEALEAREALATLLEALGNGVSRRLAKRLARRAWLMGATEEEVQFMLTNGRARRAGDADDEPEEPTAAELEAADESATTEEPEVEAQAGEPEEEPATKRTTTGRASRRTPRATRSRVRIPVLACRKGCGRDDLKGNFARSSHERRCPAGTVVTSRTVDASERPRPGNVEDAIAACRRALGAFSPEVRALAAKLLVATLSA